MNDKASTVASPWKSHYSFPLAIPAQIRRILFRKNDNHGSHSATSRHGRERTFEQAEPKKKKKKKKKNKKKNYAASEGPYSVVCIERGTRLATRAADNDQRKGA
jgi:hypothetical protein